MMLPCTFTIADPALQHPDVPLPSNRTVRPILYIPPRASFFLPHASNRRTSHNQLWAATWSSLVILSSGVTTAGLWAVL